MEFTPLIPKSFLARAESAEVLRRLRHNITIELEDDSSRWAWQVKMSDSSSLD